MDRTFSVTSSTGTGIGTGAIRQYQHHNHNNHQQYQHQNVRNSLSPSASVVPQHHQQLCRIASGSPTGQFSLAGFGKDNNSHSHNQHHQLHSPGGQVGYNSQHQQPDTGSLQGVTLLQGSGAAYFGVTGNVPVQQQQQQQYYPQRKQQVQQRPQGNFVPATGSGPDHCYGGQGQGQQQPHQTGSYNRGGGGRGEQGSHPLRVNNGSRSNCIQQQQQSISQSQNLSQAHHHHQPSSTYSGNSSATYSYSATGGTHHHHHQSHHNHLQPHFPNASQEKRQSPIPNLSPAQQMPNSHQIQSNQQNMNKNRYGGHGAPQTSMNNVVVSQLNTENINSPAGKHQQIPVFQHMSQSQAQQQQKQQNEMNNESSSSSHSPHVQQQQQGPPQYRIFKRGDSIPGISSPIQITTTNHSSATTSPAGIGGENGNSPNTNLNGLGNGESNDTSNGGSDKENSNLANSGSLLSSGNANGGNSTGSRTPLSQIGEIARFHNVNVSYRLVKETGPPHAPTFTVLLQLGTEEYTGEGPSIKKAQHAAATEALEKTSLGRPPPKSKAKRPYTVGVGGVGSKRPNWALIQLTNLAQELQLQLQFVQQPVPITDPFRRGDPPSLVSVHVGDKIFTGEGINFSAAKNMAVMVALKTMLKVKQEADLAKLVQVGAESEQSMMEADNKSPISIVHEMAMKRGLTVTFSIVQESGPPHMKVFTVNCKVGEEMETEGQGPTKQAAKKASSEGMIAKLKEIPITVPAMSQGVNLKAMQRGLLRQKQAKKKTSTPVLKDLEKQAVSPISRLIQIAHQKKFKEPEFTLVSTGTESNVENFLKSITERDRRMLRKKKPVFTIEVTVGPHVCQGAGPNKKAAKKAAAEAAIKALGYGPTEETSSEDAVDASQQSPEQTGRQDRGGKGKPEGKTGAPAVKLAGAKQIAPGIIVLKSEPDANAATSAAAVEEMKKVGSMMTPCPAASSREGIDKLAYLSNLLEISVSYSDFPKKNEYLSVVSLTTNPPHVAHGCGATLEEAQNAAALKILEELSTKGLDSVTAAVEKPSDS